MSNQSIAIVANSTWNIYNFRLNILKKLRDENYKITVIAPLDEYIEYKEQFPGVTHIPLKSLGRDNTNPFKDLALILELRRIYKEVKPDLILHYTHKANIFGGIAAGIVGIKSIAVVTGLGYAFIRKGWLSSLTRLLYKFTDRFHRNIVFENQDDLKYFLESGLTDDTKGLTVKGCGVDTKLFNPVPNGTLKQKSIFTFIGRLLYDKGISEFVQAAKLIRKKYPDTEFWVVGELDQGNPSMVKKETLLEWIDQDDIVYHGFLRDVKPIIGNSDCVILPSYREGMPRIILEAMSMAKPVITTRTAGCVETVNEGKNGFLVNVADVPDLVDAIEKFLELSRDERHDMGGHGRAFAIREFNSEKIAEDLFDIITLN